MGQSKMKKFLKRFLSMLGLSGLAKRIKRYLFPDAFNKKYRRVKKYVLKKGNLKIVYNTTDKYSKKWFYPRYDAGKIHEPMATEFFVKHIHERDCVFDIGSHLGYFTCLAGILTSFGQVHAFEVDPKCIPLIRRNIRMNKLKNVFVNNYAVSDQNGFEKIPLQHNPDPRLKINSNEQNFQRIPAIKIDEYVKSIEVSPTFIKIDVEGAEWKVLNGMSEVLDNADVKLLIEVHVSALAADFNAHFRQILRLLQTKGFYMQEIESHRTETSRLRRIGEDSELSGNTMIFCSKNVL